MAPRTTLQWWDEVSTDEAKFIDWLKKQYHGERTAADRIQDLMAMIPKDGSEVWRLRILGGIVSDEVRHAMWIAELLETRGISAEVLTEHEARYWNETLPAMAGKSFTYMCAVGHLAEVMRLERIEMLANDSRFKDVAEVFRKILPEERFHAKLFKLLSTPGDIEEARHFHNNGVNALGLMP